MDNPLVGELLVGEPRVDKPLVDNRELVWLSNDFWQIRIISVLGYWFNEGDSKTNDSQR